MTKYCCDCGQATIDGIKPSCCDNILCYCWACWTKLISNPIPSHLQTVIKVEVLCNNNNNNNNLTEQTLNDIRKWAITKPKCKKCNAVLKMRMFVKI